MSGWICLWRKIRENKLWREPRRFSKAEAFLDLLMAAAYADQEQLWGLETIQVKRGDILDTQGAMASRWGWDRKTVRSFLRVLERDNVVAIRTSRKTETGFTLVTVRNWDLYQGDVEQVAGVHSPSDSPSDAHPMPTLKQIRTSKQRNLAGDRAPAGGNAHTAKRPRKPKAATNPDLRRVVEAYIMAFRETVHKDPVIPWKKYMAIAQQLLANGRPVEEVERMIRSFFRRPPEMFERKRLYGLEHILAASGTLLVRLAAEEGQQV